MLGSEVQDQATCFNDDGVEGEGAFRARVDFRSRFVLHGQVGKGLKLAALNFIILGFAVTLGSMVDFSRSDPTSRGVVRVIFPRKSGRG